VDATPEHDPRWRGLRFLSAMLHAYPDAGPVLLPQSYADQAGLPRVAYTYDSALALLAYLACVETDIGAPVGESGAPLDAAREIGTTLLYLLDRTGDGHLRSAYHIGSEGPDGTGDGARTADQAWAALALARLYRHTAEPPLLAAALALGQWVRQTCRSDGRLGGFRDGTGAGGRVMPSVSTAENAGLAACFAELGALTGDRGWLDPGRDASGFVGRMWNRGGRHYRNGSPDGNSAYLSAPTLTAQTLPWIALRDPKAAACLGQILQVLPAVDAPVRPDDLTPLPGGRLRGVGERPGGEGVWLEGCAQYALALRSARGGRLPAEVQFATLVRAQFMYGKEQTVGGVPLPDGQGVIAATRPLPAGWSPTPPQPVLSVAATAWLILAATEVNPMVPEPAPVATGRGGHKR
jgi:hypothetical protein